MENCELQNELYCIGANVFDRSSLQFTVKLLRNHNPSLALRIQNIIAPIATDSSGDIEPPDANSLYPLNFDKFTLRRIIETLAMAGQEIAENALDGKAADENFLNLTNEERQRKVLPHHFPIVVLPALSLYPNRILLRRIRCLLEI